MKSWRSLVFLPLFFFVMVSGRLFAAPVDTQQVPENLRPWIDWTLHGHESERCPFMNSRGNDRICAWAGRLDLSIEEKQGSFTQSWTLYTDDWIPLPGDAKRWPQNVKVDGQAAAVVFHDDQPSLFLKKGSHTLSGAYLWDTIPESFQISPSVGMLKLVLKGKPIDFPQLDEDGLLWLEKESEAGNGEERLDVRVNRKVNDDIPLILTTSIKLDASGKAREVTLGKALPENFILMSVDSPIPARVENDGRLKVQVRAGSWDIEIKARHVGPVTALSLPDGEAPLAPEEVWVFEAHNNLRMVTVEGVPSVDPQQTTLPDDWKSLPAYRIRPNETMKLVERRRGDSDPGPDQLTLYRRLWLDFDGTGYSVQDSLSGTMNRSDRLEMNAPVILGRVSIDGQDQFITTLEGEKSAGVEIRQGRLNVNADSRIPGLLRHIPALGWNHDFQRVSGELKLPPGWTLLAVNGADEVPGTWISRWNLLNIFMVLILSLIFSRLWGMKWGMFALAALVLTYTEPHAPQWVWIFLLAGCALLRLLKSGIFRSLARIYVGVNLVVLVMIVLPFMVRQLRQGMYPVLEHSYSYMDSQGGIVPTQSQNVTGGMGGGMTPPALTNVDANQPMPVEEPSDFVGRRDEDAKRGFFKAQKVKEKTVEDREKVLHEIAGEQRERKSDRFQEAQSISTLSGKQQQNIDNLIQNRPGTKIQTGPGMPHWSWNSFRLTWNGPVEKSQDLRLWLLSPAANFLLAVLRVILLSLLVFCVLGLPKNFWPRFLGSRKTALAAFFLLALAWAPAARADFPPQPLLDELRDKILQNPECFPECASVSRMQLTVTGTQLRALLEISAQAVTALPLPGSFEEWTPATVSVDGRPSATLHRDEEAQLLWIQLTPGVHQVMIEGPLPDRSSVQIALPLKPHQISAQVSGWTLEGRLDDGLAADNLQLIRLEGMTSELSAAKRTILPPFFSVERHLMLGLVWEVQTTVRRLTPLGTAFVGEVPLLPGESVTDADVQVKQGKVQVSMGPSAETFEWHSVLSETDRLVLQAPESTSMTEVWILELNPVWHMKAEGIPPVHPENLARRWPREWRPWPGEQLTLSISRPAGVPGQTLTIDRSLLAVRPSRKIYLVPMHLSPETLSCVSRNLLWS